MHHFDNASVSAGSSLQLGTSLKLCCYSFKWYWSRPVSTKSEIIVLVIWETFANSNDLTTSQTYVLVSNKMPNLLSLHFHRNYKLLTLAETVILMMFCDDLNSKMNQKNTAWIDFFIKCFWTEVFRIFNFSLILRF